MDQALHARERQLLQMRQSKRLLDARARKEAAAAGIDGRLLLGLNLLRDAVNGSLAGLSDLQTRGTLVNALVALLTPDPSETFMEFLGPEIAEGRYDSNLCWPHLVEEFYRERSRNSRLLVQAGCCQLVAGALRLFPDDLEIAHAAYPFLEFLLNECDDPVDEPSHLMFDDAARMMIHHGTWSLALDALLRPFDEWKWPDFKSAGNVFWAVVSRVDSFPEEVDDSELGEWGGPYHVIPSQPCRTYFCHDTEFDHGAKARGLRYPSERNRGTFYNQMLFELSSFVMHLFAGTGVRRCPILPDDFPIRWSRRLDELFEELLAENMTGYPRASNQTMNTLAHCIEITEDLSEDPNLLLRLRAAGCFEVFSRIAVTEIPFPAVLQSAARHESGFWAHRDVARRGKGIGVGAVVGTAIGAGVVATPMNDAEWTNALECWRKLKRTAARILRLFDRESE